MIQVSDDGVLGQEWWNSKKKKKKKRSGSGYILKLIGLDDRLGGEKERNQVWHQSFRYDNWNYWTRIMIESFREEQIEGKVYDFDFRNSLNIRRQVGPQSVYLV